MRYLKKILFFASFFLLMMGSRTNEIKPNEGIQLGNLAPEINWQEINMKGDKFILLQFWTVVNPHSRLLNTQMHNAITNLETENIRLVSVSFDENVAVFEGIVKTDRLVPETQFIDTRGHKSEIFKTYRLKSGFTNLLINPEGVIVAKNVSPTDIRCHVERSETSENY